MTKKITYEITMLKKDLLNSCTWQHQWETHGICKSLHSTTHWKI